MKTKTIILVLALGASTCLLLTAQDGNPPPAGTPPASSEGGTGAQDHPGRGGFHVLPPGAKEKLNLTADQRKQVAALEAEVTAKMEKILTPEQLEQLRQMRPPRPPGGQGGGPDGEDHPQPPPVNNSRP
jgi:Spy/CpxP family protein refolding chaperone